MILCVTVHSWNKIFTTDVNLFNNCLNKMHGLALHPLHPFSFLETSQLHVGKTHSSYKRKQKENTHDH